MSLALHISPATPAQPFQLKMTPSVKTAPETASSELETISPYLVTIHERDILTIAQQLLCMESANPDWTPGSHLLGRLPDGSRALVIPQRPCGQCQQCRSGMRKHCENLFELGTPAAGTGALQQQLVLPRSQIHALPKDCETLIPDESAIQLLELAFLLQVCQTIKRHRPPQKLFVLGQSILAIRLCKLLLVEFPQVETRLISSENGLFALADQSQISSMHLSQLNLRHQATWVIDATMTEAGSWLAAQLASPAGHVLPLLPLLPPYHDINVKKGGMIGDLASHLMPGWKTARHQMELIEQRTGLPAWRLPEAIRQLHLEKELMQHVVKPDLTPAILNQATDLILTEKLSLAPIQITTYPFSDSEQAIYDQLAKPAQMTAVQL